MGKKQEFPKLFKTIISRYRENVTPNNRARTGRPLKLSPPQRQGLKILPLREEKNKLYSFFRSDEIHRLFCQSFHCEKNSILWLWKDVYLSEGHCWEKEINERKENLCSHGQLRCGDVEFHGPMRANLRYSNIRVGSVHLQSNEEPCLQPSVKHGGGSVQVWGCITTCGFGDLVLIKGIMNADKYKY